MAIKANCDDLFSAGWEWPNLMQAKSHAGQISCRPTPNAAAMAMILQLSH
jgi:hypothetical protein